ESTITQDGTTLTASGGTAWQWYLNGVPLDGETNQVIEVEQDGVYTVEVFADNGCSSISDGVVINHVASLGQSVAELYPNPMNNFTTLYLSSGNHSVAVCDSRGEVVMELTDLKAGKYTIENENLSAGIYLVRISNQHNGEVVQVLRLVVR
ncbi:MAG: T9SS type A sorting domain-containing protein, partial [Flavobacteriales bacterium]|nr:T9SS type A sorting domain-containing protein [Flavobacteriales bacterium]